MMKVNTDKLLVILGPTSTGKTDLALQFANTLPSELIAADSRQVYTGLDIGTGKAPGGECKARKEKGWWELDGIRIWMYDVVEPKKQYTVYEYVQDARRVIDDILKRGKLPIIVGGTGLYLKALLEGLPNLAIPADQNLRQQLNNLTIKQLQQKLQKLALDKWEKMNNSDRQNPRRLVRAVEITESSKFKIQKPKLQFKSQNYQTLRIGLTAPREILYKRIDERVISRINQGMVEEAKKLHEQGLSYKRMKQLGMEYGILADFLEGRIKSNQELIKVLQGKIHGYARRQMTWFKKANPSTGSGCTYWFDITKKGYVGKIEEVVNKWYYTNRKTKVYAAEN